MASGGTEAVTTMLRDAVWLWGVGEVESVTVTEKVNVPAAVGVPDSVPVVLRFNHVGSDVPLHL
jgi:hypothetical protein